MTGAKSVSSAYLPLAVTIVAWASAFPAIRLALRGVGPAELASLRFGLAALPAAIFLLARRQPLPARKHWWRLAFGGLVFVALYALLLNIGERTVPAGTAAFIVNLNVLLTALLAAVFLKEPFSLPARVGTAVSLAGLAILVIGTDGGLSFSLGCFYVVGAAIAYAASTIVQKPLFSEMRPLDVSSWNIVIGACALSPILPWAVRDASTASNAVLGAVVYLAVVPSVLAYGSWAVALSRLPATRASTFLYCVPPMALAIGAVFLGEIPSATSLLGIAVIFLGVGLATWRWKPRTQ